MNTLTTLKKNSRHWPLTWRWLHNPRPTLAYLLSGEKCSSAAAEVVAELRRNGISKRHVSELMPDGTYQQLVAEYQRIAAEQHDWLEQRRQHANDPDSAEKSFLARLLGERPQLQQDSVFARFALETPILNIANSYLRMYTRLRYYNIWHTFTTDEPPKQSQLWHRDREDFQILKVFIYLDDVDEGAGPFSYAPGTHMLGQARQDPEYSLEDGVPRSTDDQVAAVVPAKDWVVATGEAGTMVFADTRGLHKGGLARTSDRVLYNCMFTSPASVSEEWFHRDEEEVSADSLPQRWALSPYRGRPIPTLRQAHAK